MDIQQENGLGNDLSEPKRRIDEVVEKIARAMAKEEYFQPPFPGGNYPYTEADWIDGRWQDYIPPRPRRAQAVSGGVVKMKNEACRKAFEDWDAKVGLPDNTGSSFARYDAWKGWQTCWNQQAEVIRVLEEVLNLIQTKAGGAMDYGDNTDVAQGCYVFAKQALAKARELRGGE